MEMVCNILSRFFVKEEVTNPELNVEKSLTLCNVRWLTAHLRATRKTKTQGKNTGMLTDSEMKVEFSCLLLEVKAWILQVWVLTIGV
jgi:hypothetical protein